MKSCRRDIRKIRWSMLLSHHPPCDYDRTVVIFGCRFCVRCLGMLTGLAGGLLGAPVFTGFPLAGLIICGLVLTLPAAADFTAREVLTSYRASNFRRCLSGIVFGLPAGVFISFSVQGRILPLIALLAWMPCLQMVIALILRHSGRLESFLARYEQAVIVRETADSGTVGSNIPA